MHLGQNKERSEVATLMTDKDFSLLLALWQFCGWDLKARRRSIVGPKKFKMLWTPSHCWRGQATLSLKQVIAFLLSVRQFVSQTLMLV